MTPTDQHWRVIAHRVSAAKVHTFDSYEAGRSAWHALQENHRINRVELRDPQDRLVMDTYDTAPISSEPVMDCLHLAEPGVYAWNRTTERYELRGPFGTPDQAAQPEQAA